MRIITVFAVILMLSTASNVMGGKYEEIKIKRGEIVLRDNRFNYCDLLLIK